MPTLRKVKRYLHHLMVNLSLSSMTGMFNKMVELQLSFQYIFICKVFRPLTTHRARFITDFTAAVSRGSVKTKCKCCARRLLRFFFGNCKFGLRCQLYCEIVVLQTFRLRRIRRGTMEMCLYMILTFSYRF